MIAALRRLSRSPVFALATVATLTLGIGSVAAIYTVLESVVIDKLPYPDAERYGQGRAGRGTTLHPARRPGYSGGQSRRR